MIKIEDIDFGELILNKLNLSANQSILHKGKIIGNLCTSYNNIFPPITEMFLCLVKETDFKMLYKHILNYWESKKGIFTVSFDNLEDFINFKNIESEILKGDSQ
jgi:hypothetical protein